MIGRTFGQYEIIERIGAGGMGEVYSARDTKLSRTVALKFLPEMLAGDPERLARFEREARLLALLNHPHIATLYDFDQVNNQHFLVMELVEGDTLLQRLGRGAFRLNTAVKLAQQVAAALEVAHEQGIVHRDLKPSNIKLTKDDNVKVLDFGLAKAIEGGSSDANISQSPTISVGATAAGVILGTAAYMSPEQARGKAVDKRTDIWAFGCVLFEMLSGRQVFSGETVSDTIARILEREPDWDLLPANVPTRVRRLLERCLDKDPKRRLRDIGDARVELEDISADTSAPSAVGMTIEGASSRRRANVPALWIAVGIVIGAAATFAALRLLGASTPARPVDEITSLSITPPTGTMMLWSGDADISPDGRTVVYTAIAGVKRHIYRRNLGSAESTRLVDIDGLNPFFSPDGRWVGFISRDQSGTRLMRVSIDGGTPLQVCRLDESSNSAKWTRDGEIIFELGLDNGLMSVPASGGTPKQVSVPDTSRGELGHWAMCVLPDDDHVLFTAWRTRLDDAEIKVVSRSTGEQKVVVEQGVNPIYSPTGHLLYAVGPTLVAAPFDLERLEVTGEAVPVLDPVRVTRSDGHVSAYLAQNGTLIYTPGTPATGRLMWVDSSGRTEPAVSEELDYDKMSLSRDGRRLAVAIEERAMSDIWVLDFERGTRTRLTADGTNGTPVFLPDGAEVSFNSMRRGPFEVYTVGAAGGSTEQLLFPNSLDVDPTSWSPDGKVLLFDSSSPVTNSDILAYFAESGEIRPIVQTPFSEYDAVFSPDGRWIAYNLYASNTQEVFIVPFAGGDRHQVSAGGGEAPRWSHGGDAIYYRDEANEKLFRVEVSLGDAVQIGRPETVLTPASFDGYIEEYDVHPDGRLLISVVKDTQRDAVLNVVLGWARQLEATE